MSKSEPKWAWIESESARTPLRFRDRVLLAFQAPANVKLLAGVFAKNVPPGKGRKFLIDTLQDAMLNFDRGIDILMSDEIARRGELRTGNDVPSELKRLNRAFVNDRLHFLAESAGVISGDSNEVEWLDSDGEDYAMRMFIADSLRPPGLEHLNNPGPLFALEEDQEVRPEWGGDKKVRVDAPFREDLKKDARPALPGPRSVPLTCDKKKIARGTPALNRLMPFIGSSVRVARPTAGGDAKSNFSVQPALRRVAQTVQRLAGAERKEVKKQPPKAQPQPQPQPKAVSIDLASDEAWDEGNPNRTPEQAVAEYWGDETAGPASRTSTQLGTAEQTGVVAGDLYSWGDRWKENGGTRFMRRTRVPFWQKGGREGMEYDIEETLGTAGRELDNHVRRFDMDRVRKPRGEEYRRYGSRHG